jgi:hypothetical protein
MVIIGVTTLSILFDRYCRRPIFLNNVQLKLDEDEVASRKHLPPFQEIEAAHENSECVGSVKRMIISNIQRRTAGRCGSHCINLSSFPIPMAAAAVVEWELYLFKPNGRSRKMVDRQYLCDFQSMKTPLAAHSLPPVSQKVMLVPVKRPEFHQIDTERLARLKTYRDLR